MNARRTRLTLLAIGLLGLNWTFVGGTHSGLFAAVFDIMILAGFLIGMPD